MGSKDPLPASISRYKILKRLGEGGMGSLYLARDPEMDRLLAIKVLREDVESDELRERFKREARANARLNHQNIVIVYDVGEDMGRPFIAMEYIEGNTLSGVIRGREDVSLDRKLLLMEQLCDGLAYAHRAGIVHRDIKPANLMLDGRGTLKILDFGIARIGHAAATGMTQAGTLMGTLNYMSPEQMTGRPVDHRTDIFAVGAVVYEFLAYQRAFPGDIQDGVLHRIIHEPPPPLDKFVPGIDKAVLNIVAKSLEKDRENRYQDLDQMRADIAKFRARQMLKEDAPSARPVGHDEGTIVVRTSSTGASGLSQLSQPQTPGPVTDPKKAELLRKKAKQIESLIEQARVALDAGDAESVYSKCESVLMLDPDNMIAVELSEKAQSLGEQQQLKTLLTDARAHVANNELDKAMQIVGQALVIDPTSKDVLAVRKEVDEAKKRRAQQDSLAKEVHERVETGKKFFAQQNFEKAIQQADLALQMDARSPEAIDLKQKSTTAIEDVRAKAKAKQDADARAKAEAEAAAQRKREEEAARVAKAKADAEAAEAKRKEEERLAKATQEERARAKAKADAEAAEAKRQEQARIAKQQEEERKREADRKKQQEEEARRAKAEADRKRKEQEETRRAPAAQDVTQPMPAVQAEPGTVNLKPAEVQKRVQQAATVQVQAPAPASTFDDDISDRARARAPVVEKEPKKGLPMVAIGGGIAALLVVGVIGYFVSTSGKKVDPGSGGGGGGVAPTASSMTFTVTPYAHLVFTGKTDPSKTTECEAVPSCVVSLSPGVYNVRATNEFYRQPDFEVTVEAGKPDTVFRSLEGFNPESEVNKLLPK